MIIDLLPHLAGKRIILASASPRRRDILNLLGVPFEAIPSGFPEDIDKTRFPNAGGYVEETARMKALALQRRIDEGELAAADLIIASDSVVELDGRILEKPGSKEEAVDMLLSLSNRTHRVHTGVALLVAGGSGEEVFRESTEVRFAELSRPMVDAYVATGEPMDKAGAYGIQGIGGQFVHRIDGCYFNVMGFPMHHFAAALRVIVESWVADSRS